MTFDPQDPHDSKKEGPESGPKPRRESLEEMLGFQDFFGREPENDPFAGEDPFAEPGRPDELPPAAPEDEILLEDLVGKAKPQRREDSFPWELPEFDSQVHDPEDEEDEAEISPIPGNSGEASGNPESPQAPAVSEVSEISTEVSAVSEVSEISTEVSAVSEVSEISTEVSAVTKLPEAASPSLDPDFLGDLPDTPENMPADPENGFGEIPTGVEPIPPAQGAVDEPTPVAQLPVDELFAGEKPQDAQVSEPAGDSGNFRMEIEDVPDLDLYGKAPVPMEIEDVPDLDLYAPAARKPSDGTGSVEEAEVMEIEEDVVELVEEENLWITPPGSLLTGGEKKPPVPVPPPVPAPPPLPETAASSRRVEIEAPESAYPEPDPAHLTNHGTALLARTAEESRERWLRYAEASGTDAERARFLHEAGYLAETAGDTGSAIKLFARAMDLDPSLAPNLWHIRRFLFLKGMLDKAEPLLKLEIERSGPRESAFLHYWSGFIAECRGDASRAESAWEEALRENPAHLPSLLALWRQAMLAGDVRRQLDTALHMESLLKQEELQIAFTIYIAHLLERIGDAQEAAARMDAIAPRAGEWSFMVWNALERLSAGDGAALAEMLEKEATWMETAGMSATAVALHLEASVLRERDAGDPGGAFAILESRGLDHPLAAARLLDLAWRCGNREYLAAQRGRAFETLWAHAAAGGEVVYDADRDSPDVLWLADAMKADADLADRIPATWADPAKRAVIQLLSFYRSGDMRHLEACLAGGAAPVEAWWAAWWRALETGTDAARACIGRMREQAPSAYDDFFRQEEIHLSLLDAASWPRALDLLAQARDAREHWMAAEAALACNDLAQAQEHLQKAAELFTDPQSRAVAILQAARAAVQSGNLPEARAMLEQRAEDFHADIEESARWLARLAHDFDALQELENSGQDVDRMEIAMHRARSAPAESVRILESVDTPQARWLCLETALKSGDFGAVRELVPRVAADYPEDAAELTAALSIHLRDRDGMDVSDLLQTALAAGPADRTLLLAVEREFAAAGRPRDVWRETAHQELPEEDELEKWVALAWDEQDPEAASQLEAFALRTAGPSQRIAAVFARFVALRNRDRDGFLRMLEQAGPSLRMDFHRFWNSDPASPAEGIFACATDPFSRSPEELRTFYGACLDAPEAANWEALACEKTGNLKEALARRRFPGFEIPTCLAISRVARAATDVTILAEAEARLAKLLPEGHPRRLAALERTAAAASLAERPELALQASWLACTDAPGEETLRRCVDYAIAAGNRECLRFFLIQAQYVIPDDERRQLAQDHLGEDGSALLEEEPSAASPPEILKPGKLLDMGDFHLPELEELHADVSSDYWLEDARLLVELALSNSDSRLYEEAAALFLMAGETAAAQAVLGDIDASSTMRPLLEWVVAARLRDASLAIPALRELERQGGAPLIVALCELLLAEDGDFPAGVRRLPEAFDAEIDLHVQRSDGQIVELLREATDPLWRYMLARSVSEQEPQAATDAYLKLLQGDLAIPALFQILRLAWRMEKALFIKPALIRLSQLCPDPFVTLEKIRAGMDVDEIPAHPLVILVAYLQGKVDPLPAAQHVKSTQLRMRLLAQAAMSGNSDAALALAELDPAGPEPELVRRMSVWDAEPEVMAASWGTVPALPDVLRWWMGLPPEEGTPPCMARIVDDLRARTEWDDSWTRLPAELQEPCETMARLRFRKTGVRELPIPAVDRMVAFALQSGERLALLEAETLQHPEVLPAVFGLLLLDEERTPPAGSPWILACHRRERGGMPAARAWEPAWQETGIDWTLAAWRAAICEELQEEASSHAWEAHAPADVAARVNRRWERRAGIPASLPFADAVEEVQLGMNFLHSLLSGSETIEFLQGETEPVLQELARRSMFRLGLWPDLARLYLERLDADPEPARRAECFRQLIRIDSEGRRDMDSAILTMRTLGESYPQDIHNLLLLLEVDRENPNPEAEAAWFSALAGQVMEFPERTAFQMESWRLEYMLHRVLPDPEAIAGILASDASDAALAWWAFCILPEAFPFELAARLYEIRQESGMVFSRRQAAQMSWEAAARLWDELLQVWPQEILLLDQCLKAAFAVGDGIRCAQVLTLEAEDPLRSREERLECLYLAALAAETWAEDAAGAVDRYRRVLEMQPDHEAAFLRSRQLLLRLDRPLELAALLQARSQVETRPAILARLLLDLAELQLSVLMDRPAARLTYMRLVELVPDWKPGLSQLAALHEEASDFEGASAIMRQWLPLETDPAARCSVCRRLGDAERKLGHARESLEWYLKSLELDPNQLDLWEHAVDLYLELSDPRKAAWALKKCVALQRDASIRVEYLRRLSDIYENRIHDKRLARDALLEAVDGSDSLVAIESLVHFYERHADSASRNVKLDLLWTAERQKVVSLKATESVARIAHFAHWKQNPQAAELLCECAAALGVSPSALPAKPGKHPMALETLASEDVLTYLFPSDLSQGQRRMLQVVNEEACRQLRDVFKKSIPARSERMKQPPQALLSVLGTHLKGVDVYRHSSLQWLPLDPPVLLVPAAWKVEEIDEEQWQFLIGGHLFLHRVGLSIPLALSAEQLVHFLAALVQNVFPERTFAGMDAQMMQEYSKYASKIVGRKDRDLLAGTILEMGSFDRRELGEVQDALVRSADRAGYLCAGAFEPALRSMELLENGNARMLKLLQFVVSQLHVQLREAALVARMRV